MTEKPDYPSIRRIITGHNAANIAKVLIDAPAGNAKYPAPGTVSTLIWSTDSCPAKVPVGIDAEDMGARILGTAPPAHGSRFAVIDFPPGNTPHTHRTETLDYVIVIEGEIEMDMDDSTVKMKAGESWCSAAPTMPGLTAARHGRGSPSCSWTPNHWASASQWWERRTPDSCIMIEFRNINFSFAGRRETVEVLRNVSFACRENEILAVIGPSGCGKSTLLSLATGLRRPAAGEVLVDGKAVKGSDRRLGMLFQQTTLLPWRSVVENVELGLEIRGEPRASRRKRAIALIAQFGLAGFERKFPHALSGGMQKRAALAQTLAIEPTVLLLDEPFAALDAQTRVIIQNDVVKICRAGRRSMIIVTHDISEALAMADRVVVLSRRPATVKEIYEVPFSREAASVADAPATPGFSEYYKRIWDALDISITGISAVA